MSLITCSGVLVGQAWDQPSSARFKGYLTQENVKFPFTLIRDKRGRMIATISDPKTHREMKVYWDGNEIFTEKNQSIQKEPKSVTTPSIYLPDTVFGPEQAPIVTVFPPQDYSLKEVRLVRGEEAAVMLFDLIATVIFFQIEERGGLNFDQAAFKNYSLEIIWNENSEKAEPLKRIPRKLQLIKPSNKDKSKVIREFIYLDFLTTGTGRTHPKTMSYHGPDDQGIIVIESVKLNPGVPDFLFDPIRQNTIKPDG